MNAQHTTPTNLLLVSCGCGIVDGLIVGAITHSLAAGIVITLTASAIAFASIAVVQCCH